MSSETLHIMENMDREALDTQLAMQCAPVLAGIKVSNLLNIPRIHVESAEKRLAESPLSVSPPLHGGKPGYPSAVRREALETYLGTTEVRKLLAAWGYTVFALGGGAGAFCRALPQLPEPGKPLSP